MRLRGGFNGDDLPPGIGFFLDDVGSDVLLARVAVGKNMTFFLRDKLIGNYRLTGSYDAALEVAACARKLRDEAGTDPFIDI